jgi:phosphatidylglycerol:prolipoprotein diacylglycerol transferase
MCQTLFTVPGELWGVPVFGIGWLLGLWAVATVVTLGVQFRRHGWGPELRGYLPALLLCGVVIGVVLPRLVEAPASLPSADDAGPVAGGLPIRGYGVMLLVAVSAGVGLSVYRAERMGLDPEIIISLAFWLFVAGIVGARLFYIIEYWDKFQQPTLSATLAMMANVAQGGLVVYGSLLAGGLALVVFIYKHHLPGLALTDLIAPGVVLGMALGRLGCFLNGCCFGGVSSVPWHVTFPFHSPPHQQQVLSGSLPIHGLSFEGTGAAPPVIARVEPDSPDESAVFSTPWSISQNISLVLLACAVPLWFYLLSRPQGTAFPQAAPAA